MINDSRLLRVATKARMDFENRMIDIGLLKKLYQDYNPVDNINDFVEKGLRMFPKLSCGLASVYLQNILGGEIVRGKYDGNNHTFLMFEKNTIVDITADQYSGPTIYVGELKNPWAL